MELIISHTNCDLDCFASMVAASYLFPNAKMAFMGSQERNVRRLVNDLNFSSKIMKERNVHLDEITTLILVDNRNKTRMGKVGEWLNSNPDVNILAYDHHPDSEFDVQTDYTHINKTGACVSILVELLIKKGVQLTPEIASIFALGIYEDTGNFLFKGVTSIDFSATSYLMSVGASISFVNQYLKTDFTTEQLRLMNSLVQSAEKYSIYGIDLTIMQIETESYIEDISYIIQTIKRSENIPLLIAFTSYEKLSLIGRNDYEFLLLDHIMVNYGGGGHKFAAGATLEFPIKEKHKFIEQIKAEIFEYLQEQIRYYGIAEDIMTSPITTILETDTVSKAQKILLNNRFSTLVVEDKDKQLSGLITKKDISKAIHHNLNDKNVSFCMSSSIVTAQKDDSIVKVKRLMVENNVGRIPIVENGKAIGIITRSNILHSHLGFGVKKGFQDNIFESIKPLMDKQLDSKTIGLFKRIGHIAETLGFTAYLVGGFVRDILMKKRNNDIDIVIEGDSVDFANAYKDKFGGKVVAFPKFKTAVLVTKDGRKIDVATARTECYDAPGVMPDVMRSNLRNDIYRRDFSINSLAVTLNPDNFALLTDYFNGRHDLRTGVIKVMHNMSFVDDPTRILRAVRFEQRFGFKLEKHTMRLLLNGIKLNSLSTISTERIKAELKLGCLENHPENFFYRLDEFGILRNINQYLEFTTRMREQFQSVYNIRIWYESIFSEKSIDRALIFFAILLAPLKQRTFLKVIDKYKLSAKLKKFHVVDVEKITKDLLESNGAEYEVQVILKGFSDDILVYLLASIRIAECIEMIKLYMTEIRYVKPSLNGKDLINMGYEPGSELGKMLDRLLRLKLNNVLETLEEERNYALKHLKYRKK
jgi:tRNA nucleotidyltransferase (CCA-adding enzyme)